MSSQYTYKQNKCTIGTNTVRLVYRFAQWIQSNFGYEGKTIFNNVNIFTHRLHYLSEPDKLKYCVSV